MKISNDRVRQIIREELETLSAEYQKISVDQEESAALARDKAEDLETVDAWAGGPNLVAPVDFEAESLTGEKAVHGQQILKIVEGILQEQWGDSVETGSDLIEFAKAYSGLGNAVQQQVESLCNAWFLQGGHEPEWSEAVYEQNPNAIDMAIQRLTPGLRFLAREGVEEAESFLGMFEEAKLVYDGDE